MRSLAVCAILLAIATLAPPPFVRSVYEPLWAMGLLLLLAVTAQNVAGRLRLPAFVGWVAAALVLGPTLLSVTSLTRVPLLQVTASFSGLWAGLLVGLGVSWPVARRRRRLPGVVALSTAVTFAALAVAIALVADLPWPVVLVLAAVGSLWGPIVSDAWRNRETQVIGLFGVAAALVLLSAALVAAGAAGRLEPGAGAWVGRLWLAVGSGAVAAEALWRMRLLDRRDAALFGLLGTTFAGALAADHFALPTLPMGLGFGLALVAREGSGHRLGHLLAPARGIAVLLFGALLVSSVDVVQMVWPPRPGLYEIVAVQVAILVCARGVGPALWYPFPPDGEFARRSGWLLMPKGLLGGQLVLGAGGLASLLAPPHADLLRRVVVVDLFVYGLAFATLAALLSRRAPEAPLASGEPAAAPPA